jgi:hypothetical protein
MMLRSLRSPLLRVRPTTTQLTLRRCLAVAASETFARPSAAPVPGLSGAMATLLEGEPKIPNVVTDLPGPKVRAAKEAMGKIQDVSLCHFIALTAV